MSTSQSLSSTLPTRTSRAVVIFEFSYFGFRNNILTIIPSAITRHVCITVSLQSTSFLLVHPISAHETSEICWFYWLQNTRLYISSLLRIGLRIGTAPLA